jgi:hypothetical protein
MELETHPFLDGQPPDFLHVAGACPIGEPVEDVD